MPTAAIIRLTQCLFSRTCHQSLYIDTFSVFEFPNLGAFSVFESWICLLGGGLGIVYVKENSSIRDFGWASVLQGPTGRCGDGLEGSRAGGVGGQQASVARS